MNRILIALVIVAAVGIGRFAAQAPAQQPPTADPYANNARPGTTQFPLAAPAGKDSGARTTAPAGAANRGRSIRRHGSTARRRIRRRTRRSGIR